MGEVINWILHWLIHLAVAWDGLVSTNPGDDGIDVPLSRLSGSKVDFAKGS